MKGQHGHKIDSRIPVLLSITEVAELLGMTRQGVLHMINTGRLPARKAGDTWVVCEATLASIEVDIPKDPTRPPAQP